MLNNIENDFDFLTSFLPKGWQEKSRELKALIRRRKFKTPEDLLRLLLVHLVDGCSAREATARAKQNGLVDVSDVALLKKLRASSQWLRWMAINLLKERGVNLLPPDWLSDYNVKCIDASIISEPGSTGTDWRLHYSMDLFSLQADQFIITRQDVGESFKNFEVNPGDLIIGDRAYGRLTSIRHVIDRNGDIIARMKNKAFKIFDENSNEISLFNLLKDLKMGQVLDCKIQANPVLYPNVKMRLIAIRKSEELAALAMKKAKQNCKKKQKTINQETIELHSFIILITTLPEKISAESILKLYRNRWQIELAFKRFKSILGLGHLPKKDLESGRAWLHGKMLVALLTQIVVDEGRFFSPWGYPLQS